MSFDQLIFKALRFNLLYKIYFLANSSFCINSKMSCIFNIKRCLVNNGNWSSIKIYIFHSLYIFNYDKISSTVLMRNNCSYSSSLLICYIWYTNLRKLNSWVKHLPLLSKISDKKSKKSHLKCHHDDCFWVFLCANGLIYTHNPSNIVYITKNNYIVFKTILLINFCIKFIDINFII